MDTLRQVQLTALEILKVFDEFCQKHSLKYSLYAGSLLGAVRHQGFIPWDDDLDVCMERVEYDKFLSCWQEESPAGYILQNKEIAPGFTQSFSKIRKDHTTFIQDESEAGKYHTGIFLDIFPLDRIPYGKLNRAIYRWNCMKYQLLTREFVPPKASWYIRLGSGVILACIPKRYRAKIRQRTLEKIVCFDSNPGLEISAIEAMVSIRKTYASDMLNEFVRLPFEDGSFMCFAGWDDNLHRKYGDYMKLPPVEERTWTHHPILIDFNRNYEEIPQSERTI